MLQPTEADGLCEPVTAGAASLLPEPVTAATFDSLGDDAVATVLSWVSFADLLCLKIVSIHLCKLSRRALTTGPRFEISRKMSESLSKEGYDAPNESRHDTHFHLEMCRAKVLLEDDVDNLASLLHNGLLSVVKPLKMGRSLALPNGVLPLHMAHSAEAVRLLVDVHGAVVDAQRADGKTALMDACVAGELARSSGARAWRWHRQHRPAASRRRRMRASAPRVWGAGEPCTHHARRMVLRDGRWRRSG
jgi:hypothetical protein